MTEDGQAMQTRCPHCLSEQWAITVIEFSCGEIACAKCGRKTRPMSTAQWRAALAAKRKELYG